MDDKPVKAREYNIPERAEAMRWRCQPAADFTDQELFERSIKGIEAMAAICRRQDDKRRRKPNTQDKQPDTFSGDSPKGSVKGSCLVECGKTQCIFYLGDERKIYA